MRLSLRTVAAAAVIATAVVIPAAPASAACSPIGYTWTPVYTGRFGYIQVPVPYLVDPLTCA